MNIALLLDSSADITREDAEKMGVYVLRFPIIIDNEEYIENETLSLTEFKQALYDEKCVKTSQATLGTLLETWDHLLKDYDAVIYLPISKEISGAYNTAMVASQEYDGKVVVIDANSVAYPQQIIARQIIEMININKSPQEIKEIVEKSDSMHALLVPSNIDYLKRGGRITPQAAALANLLKIVPILSIDEGKIDAYDKVRTLKKALNKAIDSIVIENPDDYYWYIVHSDLDEEVEKLKDRLYKHIKCPIYVENLHPIILAHTGPKTLGVGYIKKMNY